MLDKFVGLGWRKSEIPPPAQRRRPRTRDDASAFRDSAKEGRTPPFSISL
jgi:hypothetical protein